MTVFVETTAFFLVDSFYRTWKKDRYFAPDMQAVTKLLREGKVGSLTRFLTWL